MPRIPELDEDQFNTRQRSIYDEILTSRGHLGGPFKIWLHSPELADRAQHLGQFLRYDTSLEPRLSELAILVVGRHYNCQVEFTLHERFAREADLAPDIIDALRHGDEPESLSPDENAIYSFARELVAQGTVTDATFDQARRVLGETSLVELTSLVGYYALVSMTLNTFQVPLSDSVKPTLPDAPTYA
jgi:4-carboxymuconolactone decarboxylase